MSAAVGFIGLGQIGAPMAEHLLGWPGGLVVCDVRPEACEPFVAKDGVLATGRAGVVVAVHSTIAAGTAERLAERAAPAGVAVVDAPVSGGFMGAAEGTLAVLERPGLDVAQGQPRLVAPLRQECPRGE